MTERSKSLGMDQEVGASPLINSKNHGPASNQLEAGRELDALIAERVMGWLRSRGCCKPETFEWDARGVVLVPPDHFKDYQRPAEIPSDPITNFGTTPSYSTDIASAWEVVQALEDRGLIAAVMRYRPYWRVEFLPVAESDSRTFAPGMAPTTALAICRAALEAVQ